MRKGANALETAGRPLSRPVSAGRRPALPGGFRLMHRNAIEALGEIAAQVGDGKAIYPSRPGRPNFLRPVRVS
jgi:hypothetical protein